MCPELAAVGYCQFPRSSTVSRCASPILFGSIYHLPFQLMWRRLRTQDSLQVRFENQAGNHALYAAEPGLF